MLPVLTRALFSRGRIPLSALLVGLLATAAAVTIPVSAQAAAAATPAVTAAHSSVPATGELTEGAVSVLLAPSDLAALRPGEDLRVTATISNGTTDTVSGGIVTLYLAERALTTRSALSSWLHPESASGTPGDPMLSQALPTEVLPGQIETVNLVVPAGSVGLTSANTWGARGIAATVTTSNEVRAEGRSTFVWHSGEPVTPVTLTTVVPITVPAGSAGTTGLLSIDTLTTFTGQFGLLTRQLDTVSERPVTVAIDPMIIASIRILGSSAPVSAVEWLDRLARSANDIFPLSYADADIALEAQAGAATILAPISFDQAIDPKLFTGAPTTSAEPTVSPEGPDSVATPTATPAPGPTLPPTTAELLDWDYSVTTLGWPSAGEVSADDMDFFVASGLNSVILSGSNVVGTDSSATPNTAVQLDEITALVTDDPIELALRTAAAAGADDEWRAAMAEVSSLLAVVSAEQPATPRTLLATFDRVSLTSSPRLGQTVDALNSFPWHAAGSITQASASTPAAGTTLDSRSEPAERVARAKRLLERESELTAFSASLTDPIALTGAQRLSVLTLLSNSWAIEPAAWAQAVDSSLASTFDLLHSISVTTKGPINVVSSKVDIPLTLGNSLNQAVTVRVHVVPSNGRLLVGGDIDTTIDANSARIVNVPVTAAVGNGEVTLRVAITTPDGSPIGEPSLIAVNVRADWESLGTLIFALLVVLFFGFGIWRNIVRRRKERLSPQAPLAAAEPEAENATPSKAVTDAAAEPDAVDEPADTTESDTRE